MNQCLNEPRLLFKSTASSMCSDQDTLFYMTTRYIILPINSNKRLHTVSFEEYNIIEDLPYKLNSENSIEEPFTMNKSILSCIVNEQKNNDKAQRKYTKQTPKRGAGERLRLLAESNESKLNLSSSLLLHSINK